MFLSGSILSVWIAEQVNTRSIEILIDSWVLLFHIKMYGNVCLHFDTFFFAAIQRTLNVTNSSVFQRAAKGINPRDFYRPSEILLKINSRDKHKKVWNNPQAF